MASPTLHYFAIPGNAEAIRCLAEYAGYSFVDHRFSEGEFAAFSAQGRLPFGQVPVLELPGGVVLAQTNAILRFIAKQAPPALELYPSDHVKAAVCDAALDQFADATIGLSAARYKARFGIPPSVLNDANAQQVFDTWSADVLPRHLAYIEALIGRGGTGWIAGTALPTPTGVFPRYVEVEA